MVTKESFSAKRGRRAAAGFLSIYSAKRGRRAAAGFLSIYYHIYRRVWNRIIQNF